jgi:hypothetical protein
MVSGVPLSDGKLPPVQGPPSLHGVQYGVPDWGVEDRPTRRHRQGDDGVCRRGRFSDEVAAGLASRDAAPQPERKGDILVFDYPNAFQDVHWYYMSRALRPTPPHAAWTRPLTDSLSTPLALLRVRRRIRMPPWTRPSLGVDVQTGLRLTVDYFFDLRLTVDFGFGLSTNYRLWVWTFD